MDTNIILLWVVLASIMVTIGLSYLYIDASRRISKIEKELSSHKSEITNHKRDIRAITEKESQVNDRIVIVHEWDNSSAPDYPSKGGF